MSSVAARPQKFRFQQGRRRSSQPRASAIIQQQHPSVQSSATRVVMSRNDPKKKNPPACGRSTSPCRCPLGRMRKSAGNPEDKTETKGKTHAAHITRRADASGPHDPPENIILIIKHTHNEPVVSHYSCYKVHFRCIFIKIN